MRFGKRILGAVLALLLLAALLPLGARAAGTAPVIALTRTPAYGDGAAFQGVVYREDGGDFDPAAYRITLYLQLEEGGTYWVKPTYAKPYAELNGDGTFTIAYATGGYDTQAKLLHILLIPADCLPTSDFAAAKSRAVDYVKVVRTEAGKVTVSPRRQAPDTGNGGKLSGLTVSGDKLALDIGFYTDSAPGTGLTEQRIARMLDTAADYGDIVRFYSAGGDLYPAYENAHTLGLSVIGTAWLSGDDRADRAEMDALIEHCNRGYVSVACVGSETLLRGDLTPAALIADLDYVRAGLDDPSIPVTTAESAGILLEQYEVRAACDLLMPNCYPYWEGVAAEKAAASFAGTMEALRAASPGKELIVSETGWPTAGESVKDARAGEAESARYFTGIRGWSLSTGTVVLWFDAFDEPWKTADEGEAGAHWGLMDQNLALKDCYAGLPFFRAVQAGLGQGNYTKKNTYAEGMFRDVARNVWYAANVRAVYEYGLMVGMGDGSFSPQGDVRVSEAVVMACRLHDTWHARSAAYPAGGKWYDGSVRYARAAGILRAGQFTDYDRPATRAEVAALFAAALPEGAFAPKYTVETIPDLTGRESFAPAAYLLYRAGILGGYDAAGTFAPDRTITRAEIAAVVTRIADPALRL